MSNSHAASQLYQSDAGASFANPPLIVDLIKCRSETIPDDIYLTVVDALGYQRNVTFRQLDMLSGSLSAWLQETHQIEPGMRVAFSPVNCLDSVVSIFALMRSGAVTLLLNPLDPPARQAVLLDLVEPVVFLRPPSVTKEMVPAAKAIPIVDSLPVKTPTQVAIDRWCDLFYIGTSGTTAASKVVRQMHLNAAANAADTVAHHHLRRRDRVLGCLPINHVNGLHFTLFATLAAGANAILMRSFDPLIYIKTMRETKPRIASVVPSILDTLALIWRDEKMPESFDYFVSAAAPLSKETAQNLYDSLGARVVQSFGLTETTNFSCAMPPNLSNEDYRRYMLESAIPPVGLPVSNTVVVLDSDSNPVADGHIGEVCMRGPNVMAGYLDHPDASADAFRNDWFHSGDLGFVRPGPSGEQLIVLTGRLKNIAKVKGEAVSLEEMDRVLRGMPGVKDAACVAKPDKLNGETIYATLVAASSLTDEAVLAGLAEYFSKSVLPQHFVRLETLPRTPTGKIRRLELIQMIDGA